MAGNVTGLHVFTADVGPEALSLLDNNFSPLTTALNTLANFSNYYVDSGAVNALVVTTIGSQVFTYVDGVLLEVKVANTTTSTTPTLNVNAGGAKTITDNFGNALQLGAMVVGGRYFLVYDGTNFRLLNPSAFSQRGIAICKFKAADTSRTTTTMTNDPDLVYSVPGAGTYAVKVLAQIIGAASNTGIQANVNYSGSFNIKSQGYILNYLANSFHTIAASGIQSGLTTPATTGATLETFTGDFILFDGVLISTGAGTLGFSWAQNTASANNSTVQAGSYMTVTQLS